MGQIAQESISETCETYKSLLQNGLGLGARRRLGKPRAFVSREAASVRMLACRVAQPFRGARPLPFLRALRASSGITEPDYGRWAKSRERL